MKSKHLLLFLVLVIAILLLFLMNTKKFKIKEGFAAPNYVFYQYLSNLNSTLISIDRYGNIYTPAYFGANGINKTTTVKPIVTTRATIFTTSTIKAIAFDSANNMYVANIDNIIYKITNQGATYSTFVGLSGAGAYINGSKLTAKFNSIFGMVFDSADNLYISDAINCCIRKVDTNGTVTTYAGFGTNTISGSIIPSAGTADGPLANSTFTKPQGITIDSAGNLFVIDGNSTNQYRIRKISISGQVTTISSAHTSIWGITIDPTGNLYVIDKATKILTKLSYNITSDAYDKIDLSTTNIFNGEYIVRDFNGNFYVAAGSTVQKIFIGCPAGQYLNGNDCQLCEKGTWSAIDASSCTACSTGKTTPSTGSTSATQCTLTSPGYYNVGMVQTLCPGNASCVGGISANSTPSFVCADGYKKNTAGTGCEECPIGSYGKGGTCSNCTGNFVASPVVASTASWTTTTTRQTSCTVPKICQPSFVMNAASNNCDPCPTGSSGVNCVTIAAGYYKNGSNVLRCPSNASCAGGSSSLNNITFTCSNGFIKNAAGDACDRCPTGTAGANCTNVLSGNYAIGTTVFPCPSNAGCGGGSLSPTNTSFFTCSNGYMKNSTSNGCIPCPLGTFSSGGANCTPCGTGRTTASLGSVNSAACTIGLPGYYLFTGGAGTSTVCPSNANCAGGLLSTNPTFVCSNGYQKNVPQGATSCGECTSGWYGRGGTCSNCTTFPATNSTQSWTTTTTKQTSCTIVNNCRPNFYINVLSNVCYPCPSNATCAGLKASFSCVAGYKRNSTNDGCDICPVGTWSAAGASNCTACISGRTTPSAGSIHVDRCSLVAPGYYNEATNLRLCPSNATCLGGPNANGTPTFTCSNGFKKNVTNNGCEACPAGSYGSNGVCLLCSSVPQTDSTASWTTRTTGQSSCIAASCKPDYKMNALSNNCDPCPAGSSGTNCTSISSGYYNNGTTTMICPSNAFCAGGSTSFVCSNGFIRNTANTACVPCPDGLSGTNCTTVSVGYYNNGTNVLECPSNASCTGGSNSFVCSNDYIKNRTSNACDPCPTGSTGSNCSIISPDYYVSDGIVLECPTNARCSGGSESPSFTCIDGYESNNLACLACDRGSYGTGGTCSNCSTIPATNTTASWTTTTTGQTSCVAATCKPNYKFNAVTNTCDPCPSGTSGIDCATVISGYYMDGDTVSQCPSNANCEGGSNSFVCSNDYVMNGSRNGCDPCPSGSEGPNCTTILRGYYNNGSRTLLCPSNAFCAGGSNPFVCADGYMLNETGDGCVKCPDGKGGLNCTVELPGFYRSGSNILRCPSNASCEGGSTPFVCSNDYIMNTSSNGCDPCPTGSEGLNCTTILRGYYNNGSRTLLCPSNAFCAGGSTPFVCADGYMLNETGDGCVKCPDGTGGSNCITILPGFYRSGTNILRCPSNANCEGGDVSYTCSNGYYVNSRTGTCEKVTIIAEPGSSQLYNTRGTPSIIDTTSCTATGCTILFRDPETGNMAPKNPCISEGGYYNFRTKRCINKCCTLSMSNAKNDSKCKYDVISGPPVKNNNLCRTRPSRCCTNSSFANNTSCRSFWTPGTDAWTTQHNNKCSDISAFTDYNRVETMLEKREKWYQSRKKLNTGTVKYNN